MTAVANTTLQQSTGYSVANTTQYAINQVLMNVNTMLPCKILAITGSTYTIQPLNNALDAAKTPSAAPIIYKIPYAMEMGGNAGVIIELAVSDTVLVGFCQRDISTIKKTWTTQNPASFRKFNLSDGIIIKKLSNTLPSIFIKIASDGITITAPSLPVTINANEVDINSPVINLGATAANKLLLEGVPMVMNIAGVQGGIGVTGVTATVTAGGSSIVKGQI